MKPEEIARETIDAVIAAGVEDLVFGRTRAESIVAQAIVADRARVRREAIEECAKVADGSQKTMPMRPTLIDSPAILGAAIRATRFSATAATSHRPSAH